MEEMGTVPERSAVGNRAPFQGEQAEKLQEKVEKLVMEKVAEAVQEKAEEVQQQADLGTEEKKEVL
jgi:hypothetical protein